MTRNLRHRCAFYTSVAQAFCKLFLLLVLLLLSGCDCCFGCWGRRPEVLATWDPCVLDFNFECGFEGCCREEDFCCDLDIAGEARKAEGSAEDRQFRFSIGDFVEISVFGEEEINSESSIIAPDGCIYYSFLDAIPAVGRTIPEVSHEMEQKLSGLFIHPIVTISLREATGQNYQIYGRVLGPGVYPIVGNTTLREAIGQAGGFQKEFYGDKTADSDLVSIANLKDSYLLRGGKKIPVNFENLVYGPDNRSNIQIRPGDIIYIASTKAEEVYVLGAVRNPTNLTYLRGMTLTQALGDAYGWNAMDPFGADIHSVLIVRGPLECCCAMDVDLSLIFNGQARDVVLQPGDIIYVHNKTLRFGRVLVNLAINTFVQSFMTGLAGYYSEVHWFPVGK